MKTGKLLLMLGVVVLVTSCQSLKGKKELSQKELERQCDLIAEAIKPILPQGWDICRKEVYRCPWLRERDGISINLRCVRAFNGMMSVQVGIYFVPVEYHPAYETQRCVPFPLIARTANFQIFFAGVPARYGWESAVKDIVGALSALAPDIEWNRLSNSELLRLDKLLVRGTRDEFAHEWESQMKRLKRYSDPAASPAPLPIAK